MRDYNLIHKIQNAELPNDAENVVIRAFNKMNDFRDHNGCLSTSIVIFLALEYLGYNPKLCIGKFWVNDHDFYHAWVELNGKIIDVAIYGNTAYSPYWMDGVIEPQVNRSYEDADVKYEPFVFDDDFKDALISQMMGHSFYNYCESAPKRNAMWNLILHCLDTSSPEILSKIKELSRNHIIGEGKE